MFDLKLTTMIFIGKTVTHASKISLSDNVKVLQTLKFIYTPASVCNFLSEKQPTIVLEPKKTLSSTLNYHEPAKLSSNSHRN